MKRTFTLLLGIIIVVWLVACDGKNNDLEAKDNNVTNNEVEMNNNDKDADEEITLRMTWWGEQSRHNYTNEVIELYEERNPHVTIETEYSSHDDYWRKLAPQASANELPDIIQMDLAYISQYANNDQLTDLTPYLDEQIDIGNFDDNIISSGKVNDGIYG